jgi:hypothetical protein
MRRGGAGGVLLEIATIMGGRDKPGHDGIYVFNS